MENFIKYLNSCKTENEVINNPFIKVAFDTNKEESKTARIILTGTMGNYKLKSSHIYWSQMKPSSYCKDHGLKIYDVSTGELYFEGEYEDYHVVEVDNEDVKLTYERYFKDTEEIRRKFYIKSSFFSPTLLSQEIVYRQLKYLDGCDHVLSTEENNILDGSLRGALIYAKPTNITECNDYDINSFYPSILNNPDFLFPLNEGVFKDYDDFTDYDKNTLDIVKCKIKSEHKYFKETPDNYYDTYHRKMMDALGIEYKIRKSYKKLVYHNCLSSHLLLHDVLEPLFELKRNGNKVAKLVINNIWGMLVKKPRFRKQLKDVLPHEKITDIDFVNNIAHIKNDKFYMFRTARLKPFLLSYGRWQLVKKLLSIKKEGYKIFKIDTDGWLTDKPREKETLGSDIGEIKYVKTLNNITIKNARRIIQN